MEEFESFEDSLRNILGREEPRDRTADAARAAKELRTLYDALMKVGFGEDQALDILLTLLQKS